MAPSPTAEATRRTTPCRTSRRQRFPARCFPAETDANDLLSGQELDAQASGLGFGPPGEVRPAHSAGKPQVVLDP
jgi:hypothetical protein